MTTPYPKISAWVLPDDAKKTTLNGVRPAGLRGCESGAFWVGTRADVSTVTTVIFPRGKGVEENPDQWRVKPEVFGVISCWVKPRGLSLLGIAHTHMPGIPARLSWADRHQSVRVPGILAVVIGNAGCDENEIDWGWYAYDDDDYRQIAGPEFERRVRLGGNAAVEALYASEDGIWPINR